MDVLFFVLGFICILGVWVFFTRFTWTNIKLGWITSCTYSCCTSQLLGFRNIVNYNTISVLDFVIPAKALKKFGGSSMGYGELLLINRWYSCSNPLWLPLLDLLLAH
jgi:hypothetical protein